MRTIAYALGFVAIIVGAVYLITPADSLPSFMPGHIAGAAQIRVKHGVTAVAAGVILLALGWVAGRRT